MYDRRGDCGFLDWHLPSPSFLLFVVCSPYRAALGGLQMEAPRGIRVAVATCCACLLVVSLVGITGCDTLEIGGGNVTAFRPLVGVDPSSAIARMISRNDDDDFVIDSPSE